MIRLTVELFGAFVDTVKVKSVCEGCKKEETLFFSVHNVNVRKDKLECGYCLKGRPNLMSLIRENKTKIAVHRRTIIK